MKSTTVIRWLKRIFLYLISFIFLFLIGVILFLGPLAKYAIERYDLDWLGREIEVEELHINAITGTVEVKDLTILERDSVNTFFRLPSARFYARIWPLFFSQMEVDSVRLHGLEMQVSQLGKSFNFDDLISRFSAEGDSVRMPENTTAGSAQWKILVRDIDLTSGILRYENRTLSHSIGMDSIHLFLPRYSTEEPEIEARIGLRVNENGSGSLGADLGLDQETLVYRAKLDIDRLSFEPLFPYLTEYLEIHSLEGFLNTTLELDGQITDRVEYAGHGRVSIEDFRIADVDRDSVASFTKLEIDIDTINSRSKLSRFSSLALHKPYLRFELYREGDNLSALVREELRTPDTVITRADGAIIPGQEYFNVFIYLGQYANFLARTYVESDYIADRIELTEGTILFRDLTMDEEVMFLIQDLAVESTKFDSRNERVHFGMDALINQSAALHADWSVDPKDVLEMDLDYELRGLTISSLSPYSIFHTAHPLISGNLLFEGDVHIHSRQLKSDNHLFIKDVDVAKKRFNDPPIKLPLRLAVVLLRDVHGDINLRIPVRGSLDDPKFNYGKIAWQVFKNLMIKAAAAPFKALASVFGVDEESLKEVPLDYGDASIPKKSERRLKDISRVLKNKPELVLQYYPKGNAALERDLIAFDKVKQMYLDSLNTDPESKVDSSAIMLLSPRDSSLHAFILGLTKLEDPLSPVSEHCRSIIGLDSLNVVYDSVSDHRVRRFLDALEKEHGVAPSRIRYWKPELSIVRDTINLPRPTILLNFDVQ